jgi:hypothetical protein
MKRTGMLAAFVLFLAVAALALIACSGDDDDDDDGGGSATSTQQSGGGGSTATATSDDGGDDDGDDDDGGGGDNSGDDDGDNGSSGGDLDPCALLTDDEVADAVGGDVADGESFVMGSQQVAPGVEVTIAGCYYVSESTGGDLTIIVWNAEGAETDQIIDFVCQDKEEFDGVGDGGCWYDDAHSELQVAEGSSFIDISGAIDGNPEEVLPELAEKVFSRL